MQTLLLKYSRNYVSKRGKSKEEKRKHCLLNTSQLHRMGKIRSILHQNLKQTSRIALITSISVWHLCGWRYSFVYLVTLNLQWTIHRDITASNAFILVLIDRNIINRPRLTNHNLPDVNWYRIVRDTITGISLLKNIVLPKETPPAYNFNYLLLPSMFFLEPQLRYVLMQIGITSTTVPVSLIHSSGNDNFKLPKKDMTRTQQILIQFTPTVSIQ